MWQLSLAAAAVVAVQDLAVSHRSPRPHDGERSGVVLVPAPATPAVARVDLSSPGEIVQRNYNATRQGGPQNETSIAIDLSNPRNLIAGTNDYRYGDAGAGVAVSFDGGRMWTADTLDGIDGSFGKYSTQGDPAIAAYGGGVFYYAFIDFNRSDDQNRLAVGRTADGGRTWSVSAVIDHEGAGPHDFEDKEYIAVDRTGGTRDGDVYVTWTRFPVEGSSHILVSRSTDDGATFSTPVQISDSMGGYQGSVPAVGPDGELYVVWAHSGVIEIDKTTDEVIFGTDAVVVVTDPQSFPLPGAGFRGNSFPSMAVDTSDGPHRGNVYVVWGDESGVGLGPDVMLTRSTDGGATWSTPIRVSDDKNGSYQFFPWVAVSPSGAVDVCFFDRRQSPSSTRYHTYAARSLDGGRSFGPNVRMSTRESDSANDGFGGMFIGDYNGLASTDEVLFPFWTDTRDATSNAEGFVARGRLGLFVLATPPLAAAGAGDASIHGATPGGVVALTVSLEGAPTFAPRALTHVLLRPVAGRTYVADGAGTVRTGGLGLPRGVGARLQAVDATSGAVSAPFALP